MSVRYIEYLYSILNNPNIYKKRFINSKDVVVKHKEKRQTRKENGSNILQVRKEK